MKRISIRLPARVIAASEKKAASQGVTRSEYIRKLIERDLARGKWWGRDG